MAQEIARRHRLAKPLCDAPVTQPHRPGRTQTCARRIMTLGLRARQPVVMEFSVRLGEAVEGQILGFGTGIVDRRVLFRRSMAGENFPTSGKTERSGGVLST